ncbi:uncharacterized protein K460DRAFT_427193 [Cucurbitaria berberidis CBS 394.84]|uniref:RBR-type E3 ubiquitin transferase n=1 Tax=Cucurbitaria berberidis CBS 394.84 TaxID=1168544 RepID=A0A9P4GM61_9PLEO|nr:uncharacterized protein K460DRAFT_427193 [Cucurbitaria berberidis CBS 394.84]KAF1848192.1 hypothetical protein K460DRAFT_427193 [Cucurbitaria berberidis CBS 394.84]
MSVAVQQVSHLDHLDDQIVALALQLEEINFREETNKAKYPVDEVPDLEVAYANYLAEIEVHLAFLKDVKFAHSIANAVDADAQAIADITQTEAQAHEDRRVAVQMSSDDPELEAPPAYTEEVRNEFLEGEVVRRFAALLTSDDDLYESPESVAGPSVPYAQRQADALGILARPTFECTACSNDFRLTDIRQLKCEHQYCDPCLKRFIMRGVVNHNLAYIPPRCCGDAISPALIISSLASEEMEDFQNAEIEKRTRDKKYCSNSKCGRFIAPIHIVAGEATCPRCKAKTCATCTNPSHEDDCPAASELQATLELGAEKQWCRCFSCRSLVAIDTGCNHMTCLCGAEFCYLCGIEWTNPGQCNCTFWNEENLIRRARQVVDRAAPQYLPPAERQRRVAEVQEQLRDTDDCEHRGRRKFERIIGGRRTRFQCEMCNEVHRNFILRCRRCQLDVCMDCRLHRV